MKYEVSAYLIFKALRKERILTAKGIAINSNIDTTSENIRKIEEECWDFVEHGVVIPIDNREQNGKLLFQLEDSEVN